MQIEEGWHQHHSLIKIHDLIVKIDFLIHNQVEGSRIEDSQCVEMKENLIGMKKILSISKAEYNHLSEEALLKVGSLEGTRHLNGAEDKVKKKHEGRQLMNEVEEMREKEDRKMLNKENRQHMNGLEGKLWEEDHKMIPELEELALREEH